MQCNHTQFYNHMELKNINELFTSTGKVNSAILRRDWFKDTSLFKYIMDNSTELNVFGDDVEIGHRIWFIKENMSVGSCPICGKATRIAHKVVDGKMARICKKCGANLDVVAKKVAKDAPKTTTKKTTTTKTTEKVESKTEASKAEKSVETKVAPKTATKKTTSTTDAKKPATEKKTTTKSTTKKVESK